MQVGADVGEVVDANVKAPGHGSKRVPNRSIVLAKGPDAPRPLAREDHVHWAPCADRSLQLAPPTPYGAAVLGAKELGTDSGSKKGLLHETKVTRTTTQGNVVESKC
jgi:hypothetical protein